MISLILLIFALVCFIISAFGMSAGKVNLMALGLAFWVGSLLLGGAGTQ